MRLPLDLRLASTASFPPSQRTRGRGTRDSDCGIEIKSAEGSATRPTRNGYAESLGLSAASAL